MTGLPTLLECAPDCSVQYPPGPCQWAPGPCNQWAPEPPVCVQTAPPPGICIDKSDVPVCPGIDDFGLLQELTEQGNAELSELLQDALQRTNLPLNASGWAEIRQDENPLLPGDDISGQSYTTQRSLEECLTKALNDGVRRGVTQSDDANGIDMQQGSEYECPPKMYTSAKQVTKQRLF